MAFFGSETEKQVSKGMKYLKRGEMALQYDVF